MRTWILISGGILVGLLLLTGCSKDHQLTYEPPSVQIDGPDLAFPLDSVAFNFHVAGSAHAVQSCEISFEDSGRVDTVIIQPRQDSFVLPHYYRDCGIYTVTARVSDGVSEPQVAMHEIDIGTRLDPAPEVWVDGHDTISTTVDLVIDVRVYHGPYEVDQSTFAFGGTGSGALARIDSNDWPWNRDLTYVVNFAFSGPGRNLFWASIKDTRGVVGTDTVRVVVE